MEYCEGGSLEVLYKKVKTNGWRTGEKVLGKIAESVSSLSLQKKSTQLLLTYLLEGFDGTGLPARPEGHTSR